MTAHVELETLFTDRTGRACYLPEGCCAACGERWPCRWAATVTPPPPPNNESREQRRQRAIREYDAQRAARRAGVTVEADDYALFEGT